LARDKLDIPSLFHQDEARRRILIALNLDGIVQHLMRHVEEQNRERLEPVFDEEMPLGSTRAMRTWYTTKTCHRTQKSQISHMLADSAWEQHAANLMEMDGRVVAFAKNDHLGFQVFYLWNGVRRRYLPDFLIRHEQRQDPRAGNQGRGFRAEPRQACRARCLGQRREFKGRVWGLVLGRGVEAT
jgi:type III restriction enzyme